MWLGQYWNLVGDDHGDEMVLPALYRRGCGVGRDGIFLTASVRGRETRQWLLDIGLRHLELMDYSVDGW